MPNTWLTSRMAAEHTDYSVTLEERWRWALAYAEENKLDRGLWIAFSIHRELEPRALAGTTNLNPVSYVRALAGSLFGELTDATQDVFILSGFETRVKRDEDLRRVLVSNRPQHAALGTWPLIWLGHAREEQSISMLLGLYRRIYPGKAADAILVAVAAHTQPEVFIQASTVLEEIAFGDQRSRVQKSMVDALFNLPHEVGIESLGRLARLHPSRAVRNEAIECLMEMPHTRAREVLHDLKHEE